MKFSYYNQKNESKSIEIPITKERFDSVKETVRNHELYDFEDWDFWDIRDVLYSQLILEPHRNKILDFFRKIQLNQFEFESESQKEPVLVLDVYYHFYYGESIYMFCEPSNIYYSSHILKDRLELNLNVDTNELEHILMQLLEAFEVNWDKEETYLSEDELELGSLFWELIFSCWKQVKKETNFNGKAILAYATGGSGYTDLDNGEDIEESDESIIQLVKESGLPCKPI